MRREIVLDPSVHPVLAKTRTWIRGFDEISEGGVPAGRPTLVCGSAGSGKTLFGMEFLVRGASEESEPGVLFSFEERRQDIAENVASLGFDVPGLVADDLLRIDEVHVDATEIAETGDYDLEGLFVRLAGAVNEIGARRVVLDTIENLFGAFSNHAILRSELNRLFRWLKDQGLTTIITAERGDGALTRYGIEEYVSDCVVVLDHRVEDQVSTRRLRIVKYRGSAHGTNEYPFIIDEQGFSIRPITSAGLHHRVSEEKISTGIDGLDSMLGGAGYFRGSTVLITGTAGTGKSSAAMAAVRANGRNGERSLMFAFEESPAQIRRNMASIGLDLGPLLDDDLLRIDAVRPTVFGLEQHLLKAMRQVDDYQPALVVVDPLSGFTGPTEAVSQLLVRLIDAMKDRGITTILTYLARGRDQVESTVEGLSSLADTWILLQTVEQSGERNRTVHVLKSRGMEHSNQVREFMITSEGLKLTEPYLGASELLTGTARVAQEARDREALSLRRKEVEAKRRAMERLQKRMEGELAALRARYETDLDDLRRDLADSERQAAAAAAVLEELAAKRRSGRPGLQQDEQP